MKIYNTLTRQKEDFHPREDGTVNVYCCGVTVYDRCHLGHAFSAVTFDVIVRFLRDQYGAKRVRYVVNFTDIDDKILNTAREQGLNWKELVDTNIERYFFDMDLLNVAEADVYPRATEHVENMLTILEHLEKKGLCYTVEGDGVYYRVQGFEGYGKLSGRDLEGMLESNRVDRDDRFEHPADFCLWKFWDSPDAWESPWGKGRPGWHIECSAMAGAELGLPLDIHGGGLDLKFPHHENEIAQSEGTGIECFSRFWVHHGLLELEGKKMSKSDGNVLDIPSLVETYGAGAIRHYFLGHLYRHPLKFELERIEENAKAYERIVRARERIDELSERQQSPVGMNAQVSELEELMHSSRSAYLESMQDDFNTAEALAAVHALVKGINRAADRIGDQAVWPQLQQALMACRAILDSILKVLGFLRPDGSLLELPEKLPTSGEEAKLISFLVELRQKARAKKDFEMADEIRAFLDGIAVEVQDDPSGSTWKRK